MVSKHSTILWLFLAAKDFCWAIWRLTSFFFPGIFYIFLKFPLFFTDFFFWPQQVKLSLSPSLGNHGHYFCKGLSQLLLTYRVEFLIYYWPYVFHFFLCWCEDFFSWKLFGSTFYFCGCLPSAHHTTCPFFWRGYSVLVLLRDNICIFLFGAQFFYPGQSFASLPLNTVAFFLANHCEIWPSMALYFGSTSASGQLPTYPSPNPTTVYWSQVRVNVGLGEGRWAL